jgi:hypothetical protein
MPKKHEYVDQRIPENLLKPISDQVWELIKNRRLVLQKINQTCNGVAVTQHPNNQFHKLDNDIEG